MVNAFGKAKKERGKPQNTNKHKQYVSTIVDDVVRNSDIVLEVLDSRFIEKTRNIETEKKAEKLGKAILYVFNKADLVDVDKIKKEIEIWNLKPSLFFSAKKRKGSAALKKMIKIQANKLKKEFVNVGVIGYPNTGKSSLINLLVGRVVSKASSVSGYTKGFHKIKIAQGIYLIDSPGIIPEQEKFAMQRGIVTKHSEIGAVSWEKARNPEMIVDKLIRDYPYILETHYKIDAQGNSEILIEELGRRMHFLKKGNVVDEIRTSKQILKDWQEGKIKVI